MSGEGVCVEGCEVCGEGVCVEGVVCVCVWRGVVCGGGGIVEVVVDIVQDYTTTQHR